MGTPMLSFFKIFYFFRNPLNFVPYKVYIQYLSTQKNKDMKLIIITLSNATIVGATILDYMAQGNIIYITTKSGRRKLVFGSKDGVIDASEEKGKAEAIQAKSNIDSLLSNINQTSLKIDNCEVWE